MPTISPFRKEGKVLADCVEVRVEHAGDDPFGMVKGGWIQLRAYPTILFPYRILSKYLRDAFMTHP
jgi:hypothetical protein